MTIPKTIAPGSYYLGAIVDPTSKFSESNEGNNSAIDPKGITICLSLGKPKLLSPKKNAKDAPAMPILDWSDVNGAASYHVEVALDSAFTNIVRSVTDLSTSEWMVDPALDAGTLYFWRVRAVNPCGPGPFSSKRKLTTL